MKCYHWHHLITSLYSERIPTSLWDAWHRGSPVAAKKHWVTQRPHVSIPRGSLCAERPFYCGLGLSGLVESSLSAGTTAERGDNVISWICLLPLCLSLMCLWPPLWVCLLTRTQNANQPASFQTPPSFYFSMPFSLRSAQTKLTFPCHAPCPMEYHLVKQREEGLQEGGRVVCSEEDAEWVDLHIPHISALILLHPRQVPEHSNDWGDLVLS